MSGPTAPSVETPPEMCGSRLRSLVVDIVLIVPPRFGWAAAAAGVGAPAAPVVGAAAAVAPGAAVAAGAAGALVPAQAASAVPSAPSAAPRTTPRRETRRRAQKLLSRGSIIDSPPSKSLGSVKNR